MPIVKVNKKLYKEHYPSGAAAVVWVSHAGPGLQRMEFHAAEARIDTMSQTTVRFSSDNGRTWSACQPVSEGLRLLKEVEVFEYSSCQKLYDPASGALVDMYLRLLNEYHLDKLKEQPGGFPHWFRRFREQVDNRAPYPFTYYRVSRDGGRTWGKPGLLCYEQKGADFDADNPLNPGFIRPNQSYFGANIIRHSNGSVIFPVVHTHVAGDPVYEWRPYCRGARCFIGRWDAAAHDYHWQAGRPTTVAPDIFSGLELDEPTVAELKDGRLLIAFRAANHAPGRPPRKYFCVSHDAGHTLGEVQELNYDDGSAFYSPESIHQLIRHSVTGKLYWIGNIIPEVPPPGDRRRYPLVIAEVDEAAPALKRHTVTVIDDRKPDQSP